MRIHRPLRYNWNIHATAGNFRWRCMPGKQRAVVEKYFMKPCPSNVAPMHERRSKSAPSRLNRIPRRDGFREVMKNQTVPRTIHRLRYCRGKMKTRGWGRGIAQLFPFRRLTPAGRLPGELRAHRCPPRLLSRPAETFGFISRNSGVSLTECPC